MAEPQVEDDEVVEPDNKIERAWNRCPGLVKNPDPCKVGFIGGRRPRSKSSEGIADPKGCRRRNENECDDAMVASAISRLLRTAAAEGRADALIGRQPQVIPSAHGMRLAYMEAYLGAFPAVVSAEGA